MKRIAYITSSFGALSHTFIRREIIELRKLGLNISLYGIRPQAAEELSTQERALENETIYLYPFRALTAITTNISFATSSPITYFKTLLTALANEETNIFQHFKLIYHFFMASCIALDMREKNVQHIHAHFMNVPASVAMYCAKLLGISFSVTNHSAGIKGLKSMTGLKSKVKEAKFICVISEYNREYMSERIYPCREKTYIVRCGINPDNYTWKTGQNLDGGAVGIKLLAVGRLVEKKGFAYLIKSTKLLKKEKINFQLSIIGDGSLRKRLAKLVSDCKLQNEIIFKQSLPHEEVEKELNKAAILVVPSIEAKTGEKEGIPVVIMEAMASGVLVIASRHSGIPEIVKDKITGLLVPEKDPLAIVEKIKLAKTNNGLVKACIANARRLISEEFNIEKIAKQKKKIFEENI